MKGAFGMPIIYALIAAAAVIVFFLIALYSLLKSDFKKELDKMIWLITILFVPLFGSIFYFILAPEQKIESPAEF
jgi:ABC-type enterochelin transport system permease subunit